MSRAILYSPGYGAGWVSWHHGPKAERLFMLEYAPFIAAVRSGRKGAVAEAVPRFEHDWAAAFPGVSVPCLLGLDQLALEEVGDGVEVRIEEYDGYESVATRAGQEEEWL